MRSLLSLILFILRAEEEGGQKQEQFKECVANEEGSSFRKTEICKWKIVLVSPEKKKNLIKSRTVSKIQADGPIFSHNDL